MWILVLATAASPFGFTSIHRDVQPPTWEVRPGEICSGFDVNAVIHPEAEVTDNQCFKKCASNPDADGCSGFDPAIDDALSNSLCVDAETCKTICWHLDECIGIDLHNSGTRCYLNLWECAGRVAEGTLAEDPDYSMHIKQVPWQGDCPLGLYVEVSGGRGSVDGTFRQVEGDSETYLREDDAVRVHWDGCQWDIQKSVAAGGAGGGGPGAGCDDDIDAVNFLFGRVDATYDSHLCTMGENAGYCASAVFAGVCPDTCNVDVDDCLGDNIHAANHLAELWDIKPVNCDICDVPTVGDNATDPVVASICKDTCPDARRLLDGESVFARQGKSFGMLDYDQLAHDKRQLAGANEWVDYFWSQYESVGWKPDCEDKTPDVVLLNDASFCDVQKFELAVPFLNMTAECPDRAVYETTSGRYCPLQHVSLEVDEDHTAAEAAALSAAAADRCAVKCEGNPTGEHCSGHDGYFLEGSQALCIPREACEAHCSAIEGCVSVDMHRSLPRCYLNAGCVGEAADADYNLLEKTQARIKYDTTSDRYCHHDMGAITPDKMGDAAADVCLTKCDPFGEPCVGANCFCEGVVGLNKDSASDRSALCLPREKCEEVCTGLKDCTGFDMDQNLPRCYLNSAQADCETAFQAHAGYEMVAKIPARPCYPVLSYVEVAGNAVDHPYVDEFPGAYSQIIDGAYYKGNKKIHWDGCWKVEEQGAWRFSSEVMAYGTDGCTHETADVLEEGYEVEEMFFAFCPNRPRMEMERICLQQSKCPVLTRCVVTEARMQLELEGQRPQGRTPSFLASANCAAHAGDATKLAAKQIASPTRAEYVINAAKYGPHFLDHLVYRDEPRAPKVTFKSVTGDVVSVVLAAPVHENELEAGAILENELGASYSLPAGYSGFASDIVRIEGLELDGGACAAVADGSPVSFVVHTDHPRIAVLRDGELGHATVEALEDGGGFLVTSTLVGGRNDFVAVADIDEASEGQCGCGANEHCVNTIGSFTCACDAGFVLSAGMCVKDVFQCPPMKVRVSNADALGLGWRIREIQLFSDEECTQDVAAQIETGSPYVQQSGQCLEEPIAAFAHPREVVRAMQCHTKCGSGTYKGARRLQTSPKRRLQLFPDDWSNCQGYSSKDHGDEASNELCASEATCEEICNQLQNHGSGCAAFHVSGKGVCTLHSACTPGPGQGTIHHRASTIVATSSHDGAGQNWKFGPANHWKEHPSTLVIDGFGANGRPAGADDYLNTEWWSQCYECDENDAFVELSVQLPPGVPCHIHSAAVFQDPDYSAQSLNFAAGAGTAVLGTRPDGDRKLPRVGPTHYSAWQHGAKPSSCYPLTCGKPGMYSGTTLRTVEGVESACLCKQLCLETEGCEVYNLYREEDNHYGKDHDGDMHGHHVCYLIGAGWKHVDVDTLHWISGTTGTALNSFTKVDGDGSFSLTVSGYHLSDANARLKIVKWRDADDNCADELADTVDGIGCSDKFICSPKPSAFDARTATWTGLSVAAGASDQEYRVCYCSGPCYAGWQYSSVGSDPLSVDGVGFAWLLKSRVDGSDLGCATGRDGNVSLTVDRPVFHSLSDSSEWELKVVAAGGSCEDLDADDHVIATNTSTFTDDSAEFHLTVGDFKDAASRYVVCFREFADEDFYEIDGRDEDCGRFLELEFTDADLEAASGFYTNQRFSGAAGYVVTLTAAGNLNFGSVEASHVLTVGSAASCDGDDDVNVTTATYVSQTATGAEYTFDADERAKGTYKVCVAETPDAPVEIGEVTLTAIADVGWTYVLDPTVSGSIEITGQNLDWKHDRIMLVDCEATCGVSSPADVELEGADQTLLGANTFIALNPLFDAAAGAAQGAADLPSELRTYTAVLRKYCAGHNLKMEQLEPEVAMHQCHKKCAGGEEEGCGGYDPHEDFASSDALCLAEEACRSLCTETTGCVGIDMHMDLDRCFLNGPSDASPGSKTCEEQFTDGPLAPNPAYKYLHRLGSYTGRRATGDGFSTESMLRFSPIAFNQGGSYKVCFCDHELLPEGQTHCLAEADYSIEIGKVYASGVSCLLADEKFRRGTCYEQFHGGLACGKLQDGQNQARAVPESLPPSAGLPSAYAVY